MFILSAHLLLLLFGVALLLFGIALLLSGGVALLLVLLAILLLAILLFAGWVLPLRRPVLGFLPFRFFLLAWSRLFFFSVSIRLLCIRRPRSQNEQQSRADCCLHISHLRTDQISYL